MLKSFFKWIADHTGISWIAKKVSSYWNWLFSSKANTAKQDVSQQKKSLGNEKQETHIQSKNNTLPKIPNGNQPTFSKQNDNTSNQSMSSENKEPVSKADTNVKLTENSLKPNVVQQNTKPGSYFRFNDNKLLFFTTNENYKVLEEKCKNEDGNGKVIPGEFRIFVECGSEKFCITGPHSSCQGVDDGKKSVSITSVRKQNVEGTVSKDPLEMMYKVGLDENKKLVEITRMSINPFKTTTPNLNATTIQRTVNNDSETTTTDQQRALSQELVANEPKAVGELKFVGEKLLLVTTSDQFEKCKDYRNTQSANPDELLMFIKCGANEYRIVGNSTEGSILIKSILRKSEGDKYIDGNILRVEEEIRSVKKMLGLKNGVTEVKVDSISNQPFGVKIPTTTAQQTVNNTTIDQPTSSAVTNEHKETLVNAHEEKDEHNNAASNRKVQQVEVDAEVKILMEDLLSKVSAQDLDKVEKTPISKRSEEEEFYDSEGKQLSSITSDDDTLEFQDAIDDGITQPCLITSDMVVEQVETQNTVGRVLNKPQGNNIVINGIVIPEGAKLKCFPELSNFLSKASLEREKLFCKVVPNSLLFQSRKERVAINGQSVDAQ